MINLTVDGIEVKLPEGSTVMQACESVNAEIPIFCFHERLSIAGNCRMCLVEIAGSPKPIASCAFPIAEGMEVITTSKKVKDAREGVMEFLLINHPLDCPICDQGGECDLQDQALYYGRGMSRYSEDKRAVDDKPFGPLIKTAMTRCIHCTRCVRFMDEVAGVHELGAIGRGEDMEIISVAESGLGGELSGNIIDLCPVGALTSAPYAFTARPWELKHTNSIDVLDAIGSSIRIDSKDEKVMRILPRLNEEVNEEWLGDKSRFACDGLANQRLDSPYRKNSKGKLEKCNWDEAFDTIFKKITKFKNNEIAALAIGNSCIESMVTLKDLMSGLNVSNLDSRSELSSLPIKASERCGWLFNPKISGIEKFDSLTIIGSNPRYEAPILESRIRKAWLNSDMSIGRIGGDCKLSYPLIELGSKTSIFDALLNNSHSYNKVLEASSKPGFIIGEGVINRKDGYGIIGKIRKIAEKYNAFNEEWNGLGFLHTSAGTVGALEVGFVPGNKGKNTTEIINSAHKGKIKFVWLLNTDDCDLDAFSNSFIVYQGHHGDKAAEIADVILPGRAYTEKEATYVNTEGRVQRTQQAVQSPGDSKEDWKIVRAFSSILGKPLPYNNISELRNRIEKINPYLTVENYVINGCLSNIGDPDLKISNHDINPIDINYYMTCPISRFSETMAKCSMQSKKNGKKN